MGERTRPVSGAARRSPALWHRRDERLEELGVCAGGSSFTPQQDIVIGLQALLPHRPYWEALARNVSRAAQTSGDPFQRLLDIIGLLPTSSDYVSRKAVSDEYVRERLSFGGADAAAVQAWFNALASARGQSLGAIHFPPAPGPTDPLLAFIVFMRDTSEWRQPLVDRDPTVPLSETSAIAPYDGVRNYLHWLAEASRDDLSNQHFVGAGGTSIALPTALLYLLRRHAYLTALERSTLLTAGTYGGAFFDVVARDPLIANIGSEQHILRRDYLEVDASRLGLASHATPLADWVLSTARSDATIKPTPVQYAADAQAAITALADLPTARLERLMAEHVDLCSYRIDDWITALYVQRLASLRGDRAPRGLYLGAFGWLENVRPATATRQRVSADSCRPCCAVTRAPTCSRMLRAAATSITPSLPQATAAVLRNGIFRTRIEHAANLRHQPVVGTHARRGHVGAERRRPYPGMSRTPRRDQDRVLGGARPVHLGSARPLSFGVRPSHRSFARRQH